MNCTTPVRLHLIRSSKRYPFGRAIDTRTNQWRERGGDIGAWRSRSKSQTPIDRVADEGIEGLRERHDQDVGFSKNYPNETGS
jgi:hypothetical protein